jgi:prepilin-type processing-associated H-X9-DG protein
MKTKLRGLLLSVGAALCLMAFRPHAAPPDLSSPKATVRSFLEAVKNHDVAAAQQCIKGTTDPEILNQMLSGPFSLKDVTAVKMVEEVDQNTAHVAAELRLKFPGSNQSDATPNTLSMVDMFVLVKQGETWQLVPDPNFAAPDQEETMAGLYQLRPLSFTIGVAGSPQMANIFKNANVKAKATTCLSNAKQIGLGVMMYIQDYDEITPRKGIPYTEAVYPYIKNREVFTCPLDPKGTISYTFNNNVAGVSLAAIPKPAQTVMIYEGKNGILNFRHDNGAIVGFMDGHCKIVHPEETASLIWTVKLPKPAAKAPIKPTKKKGRK